MLRIFVSIALGAIALISLSLPYLWRYPLEFLCHGPVYYFLISLFLSLGLAIAYYRDRRWRYLLLVSLALSVLNAGSILPWYLPHPRQGWGETLKVATFNINIQNQNLTAVANVIKSRSPHTVALIEITPSAMTEFTRKLASEFPYSYRTEGGGIAVFSRFPLQNPRSVTLAGGTILDTEIVVRSIPLHLVAVHPIVPIKPHLFQRRNRQLAAIADYVNRQNSRKFILAGDFNLTPWSPYYRRLIQKTGLYNTRLGFGIEPTWIEPASHVTLSPLLTATISIPIDHILVSRDIKVADCTSVKGGNSDHRMLFSDLVIN